jgi:spermidine synthase
VGLRDRAGARVLIGGLGLGFSLREVLGLVGGDAEVIVAELVPEVVEWNRKFLADVNGALLEDPRVRVAVGDVWAAITNAKPGSFDAILLDVDNGPSAVVQNANNRLYDDRGLRKMWSALRPGGRLTIWSADDGEKAFVRRFRRAGFAVEVVAAKAMTKSKRCAHTIFVGEKARGDAT